MELKYSADINDMLVRIYNFMVNFRYDFNPTSVYMADVRSSGHHSSITFCEKFLSELDYIKELSTNQPLVRIGYALQVFNQKEEKWEIIENKDFVEKINSYDSNKIHDFFNSVKIDERKCNFKVTIENKNNIQGKLNLDFLKKGLSLQ